MLIGGDQDGTPKTTKNQAWNGKSFKMALCRMCGCRNETMPHIESECNTSVHIYSNGDAIPLLNSSNEGYVEKHGTKTARKCYEQNADGII